jgi:hypothetical protein
LATLEDLRTLACAAAVALEEDEDAVDAKRRKLATSSEALAADAKTTMIKKESESKPRLTNALSYLNAYTRSLASAMRGNWEMTRAVLLTKELSAATAVSLASAAAERSAWRRHVITTHHQSLRAKCAGGGVEAWGLRFGVQGFRGFGFRV